MKTLTINQMDWIKQYADVHGDQPEAIVQAAWQTHVNKQLESAGFDLDRVVDCEQLEDEYSYEYSQPEIVL